MTFRKDFTSPRAARRILAAGLLLPMGSLLFGGCDVTTAPAEPPVEDLLSAVCELAFHCCDRGEAGYYLGPYVLEGDCAGRLTEAASLQGSIPIDLSSLANLRAGELVIPNLPALSEAVQAGKVVIDQPALDACIEYLRSQDCNEPPQETDEPAPSCVPPAVVPQDTPCETDKIFIGQLIEGQDCTSPGLSLECAPGYRCGTAVGLGVFGRCVRLRQETETCLADTDCDTGLYCSALDGTCRPPGKKGEVCVFADRNDPSPDPQTQLVRCEDHLFCDPLSRTCVESCEEGATCSYDSDCDSSEQLLCVLGRCSSVRAAKQPCEVNEHCGEGLRCGVSIQDPSAMTCEPALENGAGCETDRDCQSGYCDQTTDTCSATADVGDACPSGLSAECGGGACVPETPSSPCTDDTDCPRSGVCVYQAYPLYDSFCGTYCIALKTDGATCSSAAECSSGACIAGRCATPPLNLGDECESAEQCASGFCNHEDTRECDNLPLALSKPCTSGSECNSRVCFEGECTRGLSAGEECDDPAEPPCDPLATYCDSLDSDPPRCTPLRETGAACAYDTQCRGGCVLRHSRMLCSPAAREGKAVCDGGDGPSPGAGGQSGE